MNNMQIIALSVSQLGYEKSNRIHHQEATRKKTVRITKHGQAR